MAADARYDVIVIGAGPAGYVAAIRCAQLGLRTACIDDWLGPDQQAVLGGTCLNAGCIPSKALLESAHLYHRILHELPEHGIRAQAVTLDLDGMLARKNHTVRDLTAGIATLFRHHAIEWLQGRGCLHGGTSVAFTPHGASEPGATLQAEHVILASGSRPIELAAAPLDGSSIVDSQAALDFTEVPPRLGVVGAGVIGLELSSLWARLGSEVTILEAQDSFLSMADRQLAHEALKLFKAQGLAIHLSTRVTGTHCGQGQVSVDYQDAQGGQQQLTVDRLLVAVGRRPYTEGLAAPEAGLELDEGGFVHVDERCATNLPGVYAIGDVVRGPMLAHKGSEEGVAVAEIIAAGRRTGVDYDTVPAVIYTEPELAWVGRSEQQLEQADIEYRSGVFPFAASGRARALGQKAGLVKILADAATDRVLGVHILGPSASELIAEAVLAMELQASSEDLARTIHAHPTLSEGVHEAALAVDGRALHFVTPRRRR